MAIQYAWSSRAGFILAAAGSAVGLGNLWRFPAEVGAHGGAGFVLVYLLCVALVGAPLLLAEFVIGRAGRSSAVDSATSMARRSGASAAWASFAWIGMLATFLALSVYTVVVGWVLYYAGIFAVEFGAALFRGNPLAVAFEGRPVGDVQGIMTGLLESPTPLLLLHLALSVGTAAIVVRGVNGGIEALSRWGMPAFFILIVAVAIYAGVVGDFQAASAFLFAPNFSQMLQPQVVSAALGQAFFSLALGGAAMITYGAYVPRETSLGGASLTVAGLDTLVALLAGFAIFPIVFAVGMEPSAGPTLLFKSLPAAFQTMPGGAGVGLLFFVLVLIAGITSSVAMLEVVVAWACRRFEVSRVVGVVWIAGAAFVLGLPALFSFNLLSDLRPLFFLPGFREYNWFDAQFAVISRILLPTSGLITAIFIGWIADRKLVDGEAGMSARKLLLWRFLVAWLCPLSVGAILLFGLFPQLLGDGLASH